MSRKHFRQSTVKLFFFFLTISIQSPTDQGLFHRIIITLCASCLTVSISKFDQLKQSRYSSTKVLLSSNLFRLVHVADKVRRNRIASLLISFRENCRKQMHFDKIEKTYLCRCKKKNESGFTCCKRQHSKSKGCVCVRCHRRGKSKWPNRNSAQDVTTLTTELPSNNVVL